MTGKYVRRKQPLYDSRIIASGSAIPYQYFVQVVGSTEDGVQKTKFETNNDVSGAIPNQQAFKVMAIGISLWESLSSVSIANAENLITGARAIFTLTVQRDVLIEIPLFKLTSGHGIFGNPADTFSIGMPMPSAMYKLLPRPITIPALKPYGVTIDYKTAPVVIGTIRLFVFLEGIFIESGDKF